MIRLSFILLFLAVCIFFALENPTTVSISLGFYTAPPIAVGLLLMTTAFIAVVFGFFLALFGSVRHRWRAFRAESKLGSVLKKKAKEDKAREKASLDLLMANPFNKGTTEHKSVFSKITGKLSHSHSDQPKQITTETPKKPD